MAAERLDSPDEAAISEKREPFIVQSPAVKGGTAIDHQGRIVVALANGQLVCFVPTEGS